MRIVYLGTPSFAVPPLAALADAGHDILCVVTRVDKPAGRGREVTPPPVKVAAEQSGHPVFQPARIRAPEAVQRIRTLAPEVIVVAAYGQILPKDVLEIPSHGCINIHASLLPAYRGAAPINWAIINGERRTGITIMQMDEGMDTGAVLMQEGIPIGETDTAGTLTEKLAALGSTLIVDALNLLAAGALKPVPQDPVKATLAPLLKKHDGLVDWTQPAARIRDRVRGLTPWPGAYSRLEGKLVKVLAAEAVPGDEEPGRLIDQGGTSLAVGTGSGLLRLVTLQPEGKRPMTAAEFLRGHRGAVGKKFEQESTKDQISNNK